MFFFSFNVLIELFNFRLEFLNFSLILVGFHFIVPIIKLNFHIQSIHCYIEFFNLLV